MKKLTILMLLLMTTFGMAQEKTITGIVVDESNLPLPTATVLIKGTTTGTSTNFDGKYTIKAKKGAVLVFSYVGYTNQEVTIGASNTINIAMQPDNNLECVVVTAVSIKRSKKALGYSTRRNTIRTSKKRMSNAKPIRVKKMEVTKDGGTRIVLRGSRPIERSKHAIIVIDGVLSTNKKLIELDPINITSVNILKAPNGLGCTHSDDGGAIIIVTKKGNFKSDKSQRIESVMNDEVYENNTENQFESTQNTPLSTFSIDVDKASYTNVRRMINNGQSINPDAVKIEEFINYFDYHYPQPKGNHPFSITTDMQTTPWNTTTKLVRIGLQGKTIAPADFPASNLVFLIDVSGSMGGDNKLGLLKKSLQFLTQQLRKKDKVSIVVYAGAAGVVLEPTSGNKKQKIIDALDNLQAGGSTAGGEGIELAYKIATKNFIKNGNNRIILATDGDFNVGASSNKAMEKLIVKKRKTGVFLTCLGFGYGNYKDSKLESLADKGNGNHAYIDNMQEAQKMFGKEFGGTLYTIAKDVKIQIEFNPSLVKAYRLIGYENRLLNDEDFVDDTKDAGELGSGHTVTALYEVVLEGSESTYLKKIPQLKYTTSECKKVVTDEVLTVKFRYKKPTENKSIEILKTMKTTTAMQNKTDFNFSAAVSLLGMQLRNSKYTNNTTFKDVIALAKKNKGTDEDGYRAEFIRLVKTL